MHPSLCCLLPETHESSQSWFERGSVFEPDVELDPESDPGLRDRYYEIEGLKLFVTILCSLVLGVFFCIPIVIMALDFAPREVHVILIVSFVLAFGLGLSWTLREPTLPAVLMIGYMAALVNVNVGGK